MLIHWQTQTHNQGGRTLPHLCRKEFARSRQRRLSSPTDVQVKQPGKETEGKNQLDLANTFSPGWHTIWWRMGRASALPYGMGNTHRSLGCCSSRKPRPCSQDKCWTANTHTTSSEALEESTSLSLNTMQQTCNEKAFLKANYPEASGQVYLSLFFSPSLSFWCFLGIVSTKGDMAGICLNIPPISQQDSY